MFYLHYNDKKLPLIIDYSVIKKECVTQGISTLNDLNKLDLESFDALERLCFAALKRGHKLEGLDFTITEEDVEEIFSTCHGDFITILAECSAKVFAPTGNLDSKKN